MKRETTRIIAAAERSQKGFVDLPPGLIDDEIETELATFGYAVALSHPMWIDGYRVHTPESIQAGNYTLHVPPSIFTCATAQYAHVPDARDFDLEAVLQERGKLPTH